MAEENRLTGGVASPAYPTFQPMQQVNPLAQINDITQTARGIQGLQQQQFELGRQRALFVQDRLGSLATDPDLSIEKAQTMVADMVRNKIIPASEAPQILQHLPSDPQQLRKSIQQSYATTLDHVNKMNYVYGQPTAIGAGGATVFGAINQRAPGQVQIGGVPTTALPHTLSPEGAAAPTPVTGPEGTTTVMTRSQFAGPTGTGQGGLAGAFQPPPAKGAAGQGNAMPGVPGPGAMFQPGLAAYTADSAASSDLAKTIRTLNQALPLAESLGTTGTGPGTKPWNDAKAFLISNGIIKPDDKVDIRNELDKYLAQTINSSPLAQRSDMGTIATKLGTPNTETQTNAATRALLKTSLANAGMDAAVPHAYDTETKPLSGYVQHKSSFTQNQDPQAYSLAMGHLQPTEAKSLLDKMYALPNNSAQKKKFFDSLANARKAGIANLPGLTNVSGQ